MIFDESKKAFTIKIDEDFRKIANRIADNLGIDSDTYTDKEFITKILELLDKRTTPKEVSKPADLQKIADLEKYLTDAKASLENTTINLSKLNENSIADQQINESLQSEVNRLTAILQNQKTLQIVDLLSVFHRNLITRFLNPNFQKQANLYVQAATKYGYQNFALHLTGDLSNSNIIALLIDV